MPRYRLVIEYDGGPFKGFQAQENLPTVQGVIEAAILGFCGQTLRINAAGRTDTGVHATEQVIHFELEKDWAPKVVRDALNAHLVDWPVSVLEARLAEPDFHARFSATGRSYLYRILDRRPPPAIERNRVWWVKNPLDADRMAEAVTRLLGTHDFTTFRDLACQSKSPVKTLDLASVERVGGEVHVRFAARSFLHRQVRSMVGTLAEVGLGRWSADDLTAALEAADRKRCGPVAPSHGLYLTGVMYGQAPHFPEPPGSQPAK
jgi:tRNA pseudouridine38-40 synthase